MLTNFLKSARFGALLVFLVLPLQGSAQVGNGFRGANPGCQGQCISDMPLQDLSPEEVDGLLFMREEEKLARDVYLTLHDRWSLRIFNRIAGSEQHHMDAIKRLIDRYNLADPAAGSPIGVFADPALQSLYDELVAQGGNSIVDALRASVFVEELDIYDLELRIGSTDNDDIKFAYGNLQRGSRNHLRAFFRWLQSEGEVYAPTYLGAATFEQIVTSLHEGGRGNRACGFSGRGGRGGQGGRGDGPSDCARN